MTVIVYQCDTCNRTIDKTQNLQGLEIVSRCVITSFCKGTMLKVDTKGQDVARGFPAPVAGLTDWRARRVLYNHNQTVPSNIWKIDHKLNTNPSIQVYIETADTTKEESNLVEIEPLSIEHINKDTSIVTLRAGQIGVAQCISRNATRAAASTVDVIKNIDLTRNAEVESILTKQTMTIAVRLDLTMSGNTEINPIPVTLQFLSSKDLTLIPGISDFSFGPTNANSHWHPYELVFIKGKFYKLLSCTVNMVNLTDAGVKDGSFFYFEKINGSTINKGDAYLMLSKPPNQHPIDRDLNNVVDLSVANQQNAAVHFVFYGDDMSVSLPTKTKVFPAVQISQ